MTTRSGRSAAIWSKMLSSDVSQTTRSEPASDEEGSAAEGEALAVGQRRSARSLSWRALSSPLTYSTFRSFRRSIVWSTSVDLPIPGSPPSRSRLPGTSPPPSTRLSSLSPMSMRGSSSARMSRRGVGREAVALPVASGLTLAAAPAGALAGTRNSLKVFHCPHEGHLPSHFWLSCPQLSQTYISVFFAIF